MAIHFRLIQHRNLQDPTAPPKYYPRAIANEQKDLMALAQTIARNTTMGVADIHGVLLALEEEIMDALKEGSSVELGRICDFYPSLTGEGVENIEDFNAASHIKKKSIRIRAKRNLVKQMDLVPVKREK